MKQLGFTGTKEPLTLEQKMKLFPLLRKFRDAHFGVMHNGDCINADHVAACFWRRMGGLVHGHPPKDPTHRAFFEFDAVTLPLREYRVRNQDIVDRSSIMVACPKEFTEQLRSGTWMTIRMAEKKDIPIYIIQPDGNIELRDRTKGLFA